MKKKILSAAAGLMLFAGVLAIPKVSLAEDSNNNNASVTAQTVIAALQAQIAQLQAEIASLQSKITTIQQVATTSTTTGNSTTSQATITVSQLARILHRGMSGDDVKTLQEFLATDPSVYPQGLVTGYFGPLTEAAVKKFQSEACISTVGQVGPKTMARINELLTEGAGESGDHSENAKNGKHIPAGLLRAPGIQKKLCGSATTTAPVISDITTSALTDASVNVNWTTDEAANSLVWYGTSTPVTLATPTASVSASSYVTNHTLSLTGLTPSTTYYFVVVSSDSSGDTASSSQQSFTTLATPDTTPPVISNVMATDTAATSSEITWTTNELSDSTVWYSASSPVTTATPTAMVNSSSLVTSHDLDITGLTASTTYYYVVTSKDSSGNLASSTEQSFMTLGQ